MPSLYRPIVIGFGRFNPPTTGHAQHIEFIRKQAERLHADHRIYASVSQDPRKNPLPFGEKVRFLEQLFPHAKFSTNAGVRTPFDAFVECANAGYTDLFVVVSGERVPEFQRFAKYFAKPGSREYQNGKSIPMTYTVVDSGRSMDTANRVSGTQQRGFAADGNYQAFRRNVPTTNDRIAKNLYRSVRVHMGLHEMFNITSGQFAIDLFEAKDTYAVMAIERDSVVWQMWDVEKHEVVLAAKTAREKHPHAIVSVENKSGKIVKVFKPGEAIHEAIQATFGQKMTAATIVYKAITGEHRVPSQLDSPEALVNAAILVFADPEKRLTPEAWKIAGNMLRKMDDLGIKWNRASLRPLTLRALGLAPLHEAVAAAALPVGTKVRVPYKGRMVSGKVVRYDRGGANSRVFRVPFYVVDVGAQASEIVPVHKVVVEERMPLKGHPWHRKSDEELRYIIRDAGEAAKAMRGHNRTAEDKYLDQVNDASSILYYRRNGGKRIEEADASTPKEPTEVDRLRIKQQQDVITLKQRQANDMMAAKLRDVQQKSREQQQKLNAPKPAAKPAS